MRATVKRLRIWGVVLTAAACALAFVPLFDVLSYEPAFVLALVGSLMGAHVGASTVHDLRHARAGSTELRADAHPFRALFAIWLGVSARLGTWLCLPLLILSLNALRVRNCAFATGLAWWIVLPMMSSSLAAAAGVVAGLFCERRICGTLLAIAIVLVSIVWAVARFYSAPPIFAYDPFGGYFPGTLYDEEVAIESPLLWARAYHFHCALAALITCAAFLDGKRLRFSFSRARKGLAFLGLLLVVHSFMFEHHHDRHGTFYTSEEIARVLGAEKVTAHFVLHYDKKGPFAKDIELYAEDHELRWLQLRELLGVEPKGRVHSFLFDSAERKHQLMGAAHTFVAKPWRREIYLQADGWPHPVLMHELAHVFAGAFGDPIFGVSRVGLKLNVGLIEGVAVAAGWSARPLSPDEAVASMRASHHEPKLQQVMSLGFLGLNATQAYNLAGSFCHFLITKYPPRQLEAVFRAAGSAESWLEAYGKPFGELEREWSQLIDTVRVPERERALEDERLRRPSVFHKVCAHELALRRQRARELQSSGDHARALAMLEEVCRDDADDPDNLAALMEAAGSAQDPDAATSWARKLLAHPKVTAPLKARAFAFLGDLALRRRALDDARRYYEEASRLPLDEATQRLTTVKLLATREPPGPIADKLIDFLAPPPSGRDAALDLLALRELVSLDPARPLFHYLFARQLEPRGRFAEAGDELDRALDRSSGGELPGEDFVREALRLLGRARYRQGELDRARQAFEKLAAAPAPSSEWSLEARDFLERIRLRAQLDAVRDAR